MKSSYYIACHTKRKCSPEEYIIEAEKVSKLFEDLFMDVDKIEAMTHTEDITSCHTEVQVTQEESGLVGIAALLPKLMVDRFEFQMDHTAAHGYVVRR